MNLIFIAHNCRCSMFCFEGGLKEESLPIHEDSAAYISF
jgi:hypothetical protein